jgi:Clp amino terminal domain, pathogenicity island component
MRSRTKAAAFVATGAVALSSVAYALGTQTGGGSAAAEDNARQSAFGFGPPSAGVRMAAGLDDLADALGVDTDQLRQALEDFHQKHESELRNAFATALADALGISADKVRSALDDVGPDDSGRPGPCGGVSLARLANALGVTRAELGKALEEVRAQRPGRADKRGDLVQLMADRFNLSTDKVRAALDELPGPPGPRPGLGPGPGGPGPWG